MYMGRTRKGEEVEALIRKREKEYFGSTPLSAEKTRDAQKNLRTKSETGPYSKKKVVEMELKEGRLANSGVNGNEGSRVNRNQGWKTANSGVNRNQGWKTANSGVNRNQGWKTANSGVNRNQGSRVSRNQGWKTANSGVNRNQGWKTANSGVNRKLG